MITMPDSHATGSLAAEIYIAVPKHTAPTPQESLAGKDVKTISTSFATATHLLSAKPMRRGPRTGRLDGS